MTGHRFPTARHVSQFQSADVSAHSITRHHRAYFLILRLPGGGGGLRTAFRLTVFFLVMLIMIPFVHSPGGGGGLGGGGGCCCEILTPGLTGLWTWVFMVAGAEADAAGVAAWFPAWLLG